MSVCVDTGVLSDPVPVGRDVFTRTSDVSNNIAAILTVG